MALSVWVSLATRNLSKVSKLCFMNHLFLVEFVFVAVFVFGLVWFGFSLTKGVVRHSSARCAKKKKAKKTVATFRLSF